jgi:zinc transport system substrate-binding protein
MLQSHLNMRRIRARNLLGKLYHRISPTANAKSHFPFQLARMVLILSLPLLNSCEKPAPVPFNKITILATVFPLADIAKQVGGDYVEVSWAIESGQTLAGFAPDIDLRNRLSAADFVISGGNSEPWANAGFSDPLLRQRIVRMDLLEPAGQGPLEGLLWLDPAMVKDLARELCARLIVVRPQKEKEFRARTDAYIAKIDGLLQTYQPQFAQARVNQVFVLSTDFNAFLPRFSLFPLSPAAGLPAELSDGDIAAIKRAAAENNSHVLLVPADTPMVVAKDLELRTGVQVIKIDCLGSSASGGHNSYLDMMRFNLDQLLRGTSMK